MRIILCLVLFSWPLYAVNGVWNYRQDTSSTNLTNGFPVVAQFQGPPTAFAEVDINNGSSTDIEVNCASTSQPSSNSSNSFYVPANLSYNSSNTISVQLYMSKKCWIRAVSGTISSGVITLIGYGY